MGTFRERADGERFGLIWSKSRKSAGKSQEYMASRLGVSKRTIQNWERGLTAPDLFMSTEWFKVLGLNPFHYYLSYLYPERIDGAASPDDDQKTDELLSLIIGNMSPYARKELLYLIAGQHGSPWYSLLQLMTAYTHSPLQSRVSVARMVLDSYEMAEESGTLVCPDSVKPDIEALEKAIEQGKKTVQKRRRSESK